MPRIGRTGRTGGGVLGQLGEQLQPEEYLDCLLALADEWTGKVLVLPAEEHLAAVSRTGTCWPGTRRWRARGGTVEAAGKLQVRTSTGDEASPVYSICWTSAWRALAGTARTAAAALLARAGSGPEPTATVSRPGSWVMNRVL